MKNKSIFIPVPLYFPQSIDKAMNVPYNIMHIYANC